MRYARQLDFKLKSGQEKEFKNFLDMKIIPELQKQNGFQDELVLTSGRDVTAISMWDTRKHAEDYEKNTYPKVLKSITPMIEAAPEVKACEVCHTSFHAPV